MLIIRKEQMAVFSQIAQRKFENRIVAHVNEQFPNHEAVRESQTTKKWIAHGIKKAKQYGFVAEIDIVNYVNLMFVFGQDFDDSEEYQWAKNILGNEELTSTPAIKMKKLYSEAKLHEPNNMMKKEN